MRRNEPTTQREYALGEDETLLSVTDLKGRIVYANDAFIRVSGFGQEELYGHAHNVVRHPDMPRGVYRLMWETLKDEREFFGVVKNMTADGDFYWVLANVTLDRLPDGEVVGYYSVRRSVSAEAIGIASELYAQMMRIERDAGAASAPEASLAWLRRTLAEKNTDYDQFVLANCLG